MRHVMMTWQDTTWHDTTRHDTIRTTVASPLFTVNPSSQEKQASLSSGTNGARMSPSHNASICSTVRCRPELVNMNCKKSNRVLMCSIWLNRPSPFELMLAAVVLPFLLALPLLVLPFLPLFCRSCASFLYLASSSKNALRSLYFLPSPSMIFLRPFFGHVSR